MKIFKLVKHKYDGKLYSFNGVGTKIQAGNKRYVPNKWTVASPSMFELGFGLAGFKTLKSLLKFCTPYICSKIEIWEAKAFIPKRWKPSKKMAYGGFYSFNGLKHSIKRNTLYANWPSRTVLVQKIKLLRKIERSEYEHLL